MSLLSDRDSSLRRSHSLPYIASTNTSRTFIALGYSGSCSDLGLTQYGYNKETHREVRHRHHRRRHNHHHRHRQDEPKNGARLDLRQLMTLRQHYYPEGGWGFIIIFIGLIMQCIAHGIHMSAGVVLVEIMRTFHVSSTKSGDNYIPFSTDLITIF